MHLVHDLVLPDRDEEVLFGNAQENVAKSRRDKDARV
jgi:hypothetical protein